MQNYVKHSHVKRLKVVNLFYKTRNLGVLNWCEYFSGPTAGIFVKIFPFSSSIYFLQ